MPLKRVSGCKRSTSAPRSGKRHRRGEHVGNQVPPGFTIEIKAYKSNGSFILGKWLPYSPHAEVDIKILEEYVRQNGSEYRAAQALRGLVFPYFSTRVEVYEDTLITA